MRRLRARLRYRQFTDDLLLALLAGPALRGFLYGLSPSDPMSQIAVVFVVVLTAWVATILPMRRALRVDPAITLRHD